MIHESYKKGRCCCLCQSQVVIKKHPWNKGKAKGSILETMGYGCAVDIGEPERNVTFSDSAHGDCEMFEKRKP